MVILATIEGLKSIEKGEVTLDKKRWKIKIQNAATIDAIFEVANTLARIHRCYFSLARSLMKQLPTIFSVS